MAVVVEVEIGSKQALGSLNDLKTAAGQLEDKINNAQFGSDEFKRLSSQLKGVRNELKDFDAQLEGLDKEQKATALVDTFNGLTGAVGAVSSAFLAFGANSEQIENAEKKLLGVIGVVSGLRDASNGLVAAGKLFGPTFTAVGDSIKAGFTAGATGAQTFKAALISTGIGAFIVLVGLAASALMSMGDSEEEAAAQAKRLEDQLENTNDALANITKAYGTYTTEIDRSIQKQLNAAKKRGASEDELRKIEEQGLARKEKVLQAEYDKQLEYNLKLFNDRKTTNDQILASNAALATAQDKLNKFKLDSETNSLAAEEKAREKSQKQYEDYIDNKIAARDREIQANEQYDLAEIESRRIVADALAKTEEEKAAIDLKFTNERIDRQIKALKESEANKAKEEKDAKALQASILELENERASKVIETNGIIEESNKTRLEAQTAREKAFATLTQQLGAEAATNILTALNEQIATIEATTIANVERLQALKDQIIEQNRAKSIQDNETAKQDKLTALQTQLDAELALYEGNELKLAEIKALYGEQAKSVEQQAADNAVTINATANAQIVANEQQTAEQIAVINEARKSSQLDLASAIGGSIAALGGLFEKGTAASKAAALADIAIGTGVGFINALDIAQKSAKATGPGAAFAFPIFYATQLAAVLGAASRAKSILATTKGGGGGGGNTPTPPNNPSTPTPTGPPTIGSPNFGIAGSDQNFKSSTALENAATVKTYVLAGDVTSAQAANEMIQQKRQL